jgi:hypothetical protein
MKAAWGAMTAFGVSWRWCPPLLSNSLERNPGKMERDEMLRLWDDMAKEGNWVPSWTDSLAGLSAEAAAWSPDANCHSVWQEVSHVIFWRNATLKLMSGGPPPTQGDIENNEFQLPAPANDDAWKGTVAELARTHSAIAAAIQDPTLSVTRVAYHLIHDAYHLGRITQLRAMQGSPPVF